MSTLRRDFAIRKSGEWIRCPLPPFKFMYHWEKQAVGNMSPAVLAHLWTVVNKAGEALPHGWRRRSWQQRVLGCTGVPIDGRKQSREHVHTHFASFSEIDLDPSRTGVPMDGRKSSWERRSDLTAAYLSFVLAEGTFGI